MYKGKTQEHMQGGHLKPEQGHRPRVTLKGNMQEEHIKAMCTKIIAQDYYPYICPQAQCLAALYVIQAVVLNSGLQYPIACYHVRRYMDHESENGILGRLVHNFYLYLGPLFNLKR